MPEFALPILKQAIQSLRSVGIDESELDAKYILSHVLGVPHHALYTKKSLTVSGRQKRAISRMLKKRISGMPIQYIIGEQHFYGLPFRVTPRVLIPRSETELLVEKALEKAAGLDAPRFLDLCTGSGCIPVALKTKRPKATIFASDISSGALRIAKQNARLNNVGIRFMQSDLFKRIQGTFDIITVNPPYINMRDYHALDDKVRKYEPKLALFGGRDGLDFIRAIISRAGAYLNPGGWLLMEIGHDQREAAEQLMAENGYIEIRTFSDYSGFNRIVTGKRAKVFKRNK